MPNDLAINVKATVAETGRYLTYMQRTCLPTIARTTLKRTMTGIRTDASRIIRKNFNLKAKAVKDHLKIGKVDKRLRGELIGEARTFSLLDFPGTRQTKTGVSFRILKRSGRIQLKSAFVHTSKKGNKVVLRRARGGGPSGLVGRKPLTLRMGPSIASQLDKRTVRRELNTAAARRWDTEFDRQANYYLNVKRCGRPPK